MQLPSSEPHSRATRLRAYLQQDPSNVALRADLIDALLAANQMDAAHMCAEEGLQRAPNHPQLRYLLAVADHLRGDLPQARMSLEALVAEGLNEPAVWHQLARVAYDQGDWSATVQVLQQLLDHQPLPEDLAETATLLLVRSLHRMSELDPAIERAERWLLLKPDSVLLRSPLATLYLDAKRLPDAHRLFLQSQQAGTLDPEMLAVGGYLALDAGEPGQAQALFERSIDQSPQMGRAHLGLGLTLAAEGRLEPAMAALRRATETMPQHLGSWHALAWMQLVSRQWDAAEATFNQALAADRNFGDTYGGLAILAALRGQREKADELIRVGRKLDPMSLNVGAAITLLRHGGTLENAEFVENALQMLHAQALSKDPAMRSAFERLMQRLQRPARD